MRATDLILKKRGGGHLSPSEIDWLVSGYMSGRVPDYQMSAMCMAMWFSGLDGDETATLTRSMAASGETVDLGGVSGFKVDKHSTGGVADTTTLVLGPLVAACGAKVAKMSGRGLGHTGGTIDKLESIPGMKTEFGVPEFIDLVNRVGIAVVGQSVDLAPADKRLYALRDATGTVDSMGLIASSIVSKKLAAGSDGILLDVKTGRGAFMKTHEESRQLAMLMVTIGKAAGKRMEAAITDMDEPLGNAIGNALEVREAIETLSGSGPGRLKDLCVCLGSRMLLMAGIAQSDDDGRSRISAALDDGRGLAKLREMVVAQGGDPHVIDTPSLLPTARFLLEVRSRAAGVVTELDGLALGVASVALGAGRARKEDSIDAAVGIVMLKRVGDSVHAGEPLAMVHANDSRLGQECTEAVSTAYHIGPGPAKPRPLIYEFLA